MIPARKTPPLEWLIYHTLVRPAIRRAFHRVAIADRAVPPADLPVLAYLNHPSWWDGYLAFLLSRELWRRDTYLMMEAPQLARYGFFRYGGVFGVDRHDRREGMRSVRYAADLLRASARRVVWIFPQGTITPNDRRPLTTFSGVAHIAVRAAPIRCVPVALRFEFLGQQRPEALIRIGEAHRVDADTDVKALHREMDRRLTATVDRLRDDTIEGATDGYTTLLRGRDSVNVVWDRVRAAVLGRGSA